MKTLSKIYNGLIFLFLYAPIVVLIIFSFNDSRSRSVWHGFSLRWHEELFHDKEILNALMVTLTVAVIATVVATVIGTAMMLLFAFIYRSTGWFQLGYGTLLLSHITFCIPYVVLQVMPKLRKMNQHMYEAALDLGCRPVSAFFKVMLPEIMPGVVTGALMAFTMSMDDFVISLFTSGSSAQNLSVTIYSMVKRRITPEINALSTLMFGAVLILLILVNVSQIRGQSKAGKA